MYRLHIQLHFHALSFLNDESMKVIDDEALIQKESEREGENATPADDIPRSVR